MHNHLNVLIDGVCAGGRAQHCIDLHQAQHEVSTGTQNCALPFEEGQAIAMLLIISVQTRLPICDTFASAVYTK